MRKIKLFENFDISEAAELFKRGQVYKDKDGKLWVYYRAAWGRWKDEGRGREKNPNAGLFFALDDIKSPRDLNPRAGGNGGGPIEKELPLVGMVKVADSMKKMKDAESGVDVNAVQLIKRLPAAVGKIERKDWLYDAPHFYSSLKGGIRGLEGLGTGTGGDGLLKALRALNIPGTPKSSPEYAELANSFSNANAETIAQVKNVLKTYKDAVMKLRETSTFKMDYILYDEFRYNEERDDEEAMFVKYVINKEKLIGELDPYENGVSIKIVEPIKQGGTESASGSIVYFHAELTGAVDIDGKVYKASMSDSKRSGGWNYND